MRRQAILKAVEAGRARRALRGSGLSQPHARLCLFSDDPDRWNFMRRLLTEDARRMAQQILWLPELVRIARGSIQARRDCCVYRKPKPGRSDDEVRRGWRVI
jgi:hypothetical protein